MFDRPSNGSLNRFTFGLEGAVLRRADRSAIFLQKLSQPLKNEPSGSPGCGD
jgi:hypothetical protein